MMVVGDAALFVNVVGWEGTNLAAESGILAGEVAVYAHKIKDFSAKTLKLYEEKLKNSFVLRDLRKFRRIPPFLYKNKDFFSAYPEMIRDSLRIWHTVDGEPKEIKIKKIRNAIFQKVGTVKLIKDVAELVRGMLF